MTLALTVAVTNESTVLTDEEVELALPAFHHQALYHFAPYWHTTANLHMATPGAIPKGMSHIAIVDDSDQAGALGYHDLDSTLAPDAFIFAKTDQQYGLSWSVTFSHELLEILGDEWISSGWQVGYDWWALEVCDPVEADEYGYEITWGTNPPVLCSDFILPRYFIQDAPPYYDYKHYLSKPLDLLPGGYQSIFKWGKGWTQKFNNGDRIVEGELYKPEEDMKRPRPSQDLRRQYAKAQKEAKQ